MLKIVKKTTYYIYDQFNFDISKVTLQNISFCKIYDIELILPDIYQTPYFYLLY